MAKGKKRSIPKRKQRPSPWDRAKPKSSLMQRGAYLPTDLQISAAESAMQDDLSEEDAFDIAAQMHPDLEKLLEKDKLPEELDDGQGNIWNPHMHLHLHAIIERQLSNDDPKGIVQIATDLEEQGVLDPHEIRHVMAASFAEALWDVQDQGIEFDTDQYLEGIHRAYAEFVEALS